MEEFRYCNTGSTSVLADLGPLPEVMESNSDTAWKLFEDLQSGVQQFPQMVSSAFPPLESGASPLQAGLSVQDVLLEARRNNRVCPVDAQWKRLCALLRDVTGSEPPAAAAGHGPVSRLVKRMMVRDQIEWAAEHGYLAVVLRFLRSLPEDQWVHMGA